jgi:hypothetical protein
MSFDAAAQRGAAFSYLPEVPTVKTGFVVAPPMPSTGRRMACVLVAYEFLAAILQGEFAENYLSSAPADLTVVAVGSHDANTLAIYVESKTFEPLDETGKVPVYVVTLSRIEVKK